MPEILFENNHYIAANKPSGLFVHPYKAESNIRECLLKEVRDYVGEYVYPIHRLDRPVSGVVLFAKKSEAVSPLKDTWHSDNVIKKYTALVKGVLSESGQIDFSLQNEQKVKQECLTLYKPIEVFEYNTLLEVEIKTGRRHQIRRHLSRSMHQIIGDTAHGKGKVNKLFRDQYKLNRIFLHAHYLKFKEPFSGEDIEINCQLPNELTQVIEMLRD